MKKLLGTILSVLFVSSVAVAIPTDVIFEDLPYQDPLIGPNFVHELGNNFLLPLFPPEEEIDTADTFTDQTACPDEPGDDPTFPNALVIMTNKTGMDWRSVWYVADGYNWQFPMETSLTNFDGLVNGALAFKIDRLGINRPLVSESMINDGVFQAGETWEFIIQDYQNILGLPASAMGSPGVPSTGENMLSSGSIIAIPEPGTMALLIIGGAAALIRRRGK